MESRDELECGTSNLKYAYFYLPFGVVFEVDDQLYAYASGATKELSHHNWIPGRLHQSASL